MGEEVTVTEENALHRRRDDERLELDIYPLSCYYFGSKDAIPFKDRSFLDRLQRMKSNYAARGMRTCVEAVIMGVMGEEVTVTEENALHRRRDDERLELDIYPLSCYYFGSKDAIPFKDRSFLDRLQRMKSNYAARGMRTCVEAVIMVELFKHPHLLLLQVRNSIFKLPGGRLRPGESETDGLRRKLARKLSVDEDGDGAEWEVGECLGMWWRPDFETLMYPFLPPNVKQPKECTKLFLVKLPASRKFIVPKNLRLLSVPLCQVHENHKTYGPIISGIPQLLSKFSFNMIEC